MLDLLLNDEFGLIVESQFRIRFALDSYLIRNVAGARRPRNRKREYHDEDGVGRAKVLGEYCLAGERGRLGIGLSIALGRIRCLSAVD